jgi:hypothetical protein
MAIVVAMGDEVAAEDNRAVIHFADLNGIANWRPVSGYVDALLIEGRNGDWYRVTFWGACPEIHYTPTIGFVTDLSGNLDRFSSIVADGRQCHFRTFERTDDVPSE